ncbi:TPA_asm: hypothetical protein vir519_00055 [Caudoviricetes sp. vir519]|nr:TPA_asm: hypothetical protein vir519_00055 [Caudoviricetes sp. vir519]
MYVCMYVLHPKPGGVHLNYCPDLECEMCSFFENGRCKLPRDFIFRIPDEWRPILRKLKEDCPPGTSFAEFVRDILTQWTVDNNYSLNLERKLREAKQQERDAQARIRFLTNQENAIRESAVQQTLLNETFEAEWRKMKIAGGAFLGLGRDINTYSEWERYVREARLSVTNFARRCKLSTFQLNQRILADLRDEPKDL